MNRTLPAVLLATLWSLLVVDCECVPPAPCAADDDCLADQVCGVEDGRCGPGEGEGEGEPGLCGDGVITADEDCDDDNDLDGDGCEACLTSEGFVCVGAPSLCHPVVCGDGLVDGDEGCDDENVLDGDGCEACGVAGGFVCTGAPSTCRETVCGDAVAEGDESCDDGNVLIGDGCANCQLEPVCSGGVCTPVCGDGAVFVGEDCDDGNRIDGDGCSGRCVFEPGFVCTLIEDDPPATQVIPIVYRDFRGRDLDGGHCDFQRSATPPAACNGAIGSGSEAGIVEPRWDSISRKPRYGPASGRTTSTTDEARFSQWYTDVDGVNVTVGDTLTLVRQPDSTYVFENRAFFPLDGRGFVAAGTEQPRNDGHNFHFTSELRFWFTWTGEAITLSFFGDDDVWVFINGHLAVDIGGIHGPVDGAVTINAANQATFELVPGGVYEAAVFQAERQTVGSQYKLTLAGFFPPRTRCEGDCGDGVVVGDEACDDGVVDNDGRYGGCTATCERAPFCGDGDLSAPQEACDDGRLNGRPGSCALDCQGQTPVGPVCGNAVVDDGEVCDDGVNDGAYNGCAPGCLTRGPFCGDGVTQSPPEGCDDGDTIDGNGCSTACVVVIGG